MTTLSFASKPHPRTDYITPLLARSPSLIPDRWAVLLFSAAVSESVLARYDQLEIRRTEGGFAAQTRVKGEREQAIATALCRLRQFLCRNYRSGIQLRLCRPLMQSEEAPGRWLVRIGLSGPDTDILSPASRGGRVRVQPVAAETIAVTRLSGRPTQSCVRQGVAAILDSLASTPWTATGKPMVRLQAPVSILPFSRHFEVAIPVTERRAMGCPGIQA